MRGRVNVRPAVTITSGSRAFLATAATGRVGQQGEERRAVQGGLVRADQRAGDSLLLEIASAEMSVWELNIATPPPGK